MFRAIKDYDGSESSKCIDLQIGDNLGAVHALDEIWFIGYNNRTGETGAFPIECVEDVQESDSNDEFGELSCVHIINCGLYTLHKVMETCYIVITSCKPY